jgi:hypothetical protein
LMHQNVCFFMETKFGCLSNWNSALFMWKFEFYSFKIEFYWLKNHFHLFMQSFNYSLVGLLLSLFWDLWHHYIWCSFADKFEFYS